MKLKIISVVTLTVAAMIVMVLHELPKTLVYYSMDKDVSKRSIMYATRIFHYIDPIGLLLCIATYGGFSKPYMYRIKDKKINKMLGITGFLSLGIIFFLSVFILKYVFFINRNFASTIAYDTVYVVIINIFFNMAIISLGMIIVNLFPIATFDMGNLIAAYSPEKFFDFLRKEYFIKILLLFILLMDIISNITTKVISFVLR